jgi:hypothetical protein
VSFARIRQNGEQVQVLLNGRLAAELSWQDARQLAAAIKQVSLLAEAEAKHEGIITDQAILMRAGVRLGLTSDRRMLGEAAKEAAWGRNLRRYMRGGVKSREVFGLPTVIQHPPRTPK